MNNTWRNLKKVDVDGLAFKRARLAFKAQDISVNRGEYGHGSQEWLAKKAMISPRAISSLERGKASLKTVDAVSKVLGIQGRKYIRGYGADSITLRTTGVVDFRPTINGCLPGNNQFYLDEPFLLTLLPITITVNDEFIDEVILQKMRITLSVGTMVINFIWLYKVNLTDRATTWLGDEQDIGVVNIKTMTTYQESILFKQENFPPVSWGDFIKYVKQTDDTRISLELTLEFEYCNKSGFILVSVEELKGIFDWAFPTGFPYWVEPNALMP